MKALPFRIPKNSQQSFRVQVDQDSFFYDRLHYHSEWQITSIEKGRGTLFVGDGIHRFQEGDVFIIGSNLPHLLKSDSIYYQKDSPGTYAISLFFDQNSFGTGFFDLPELAKVNSFLQEASHGIRFIYPEKKNLQVLIHSILKKEPFSRFQLMIDILGKLASWSSKEQLSISSFTEAQKEIDGHRLNEVFQYTLNQYTQNITLDQIAQVANLSIPAFCRYFKLHTRKSYIRFLNEIRVNAACKLLKESDHTISYICFNTGFQNLSNFNRQFKKIMDFTPSKYREMNG